MGTKNWENSHDYDNNDYVDLDDFDDQFIDFDIDIEESTENYKKLSTRRKIEYRNELKKLREQLDDWDDYDTNSGWN